MANSSSNALLLIIHLLLALFFTEIFLTRSTTASLNSEKNGFSLPLLHRDYVLNPSLYANLTREERMIRLFQSSYDPSTLLLPLKLQMNGFMTEINLGFRSRPQNYNLVVDLSSHLTWLQCVPCNPSFFQKKPKFDPNRSVSFLTVNATDPLCRAPFFADIGNKCGYNIRYPYGNYVYGFLSRDLFTFKILGSQTQTTIEPLYFGCTHASQMNIFTGEPVGIMGMNRAQVSFPKQLAQRDLGRFSYCMYKSTNPYIGFLRFGNDIVDRGPMKTTPFKSGPLGEAYDLFLDGISLGNVRLDLERRVFERTYINSTAMASQLVEPAYELLKHTLMLYFEHFGLVQVHVPEYPMFEVCYHLPQNYMSILPTMTWHLRGGDLLIQIPNLFVIDTHKNYFCLAITSDPHMTVLGVYQQFDYRFIFDLNNNVLSYRQEDCARDP